VSGWLEKDLIPSLGSLPHLHLSYRPRMFHYAAAAEFARQVVSEIVGKGNAIAQKKA
jgi:hypothetical protein